MRVFITTALIALCTAPFAAAQTHPSEADIIITATRTPTPAERLPARIDVIDRAVIEAEGLATLPQALGAEAIQSGGIGSATSLFIRGANSNHALALFDGVRLNDASTPTGAYNFGLDTLAGVERVEIVRGPLATLYGTDAIGGAVNIIPRRGADALFSPFAEAEGGSFNTWRGVLGAAGTTGGFSYGVSAEAYDTDGYDQIPKRMTTRTGETDGADIDTFTGSARYESEGFGFDLLARRREGRTDYDNGFPRTENADLHQETTQTLWRLGADASLMRGLTARLAGGQADGESQDFNGGVLGNDNRFSRDFADLTLQWRADALGALDAPSLTAGYSWEREHADITGGFNNPLHAGQDHRGGYVVAQSGFGGGFSATLTGRLDDYDGFGTHGVYALGLVSDLAAHGAPVRLFASYGTAFHAPSLSERFASSLFSAPNPGLKPEQSKSWEIGTDASLIRDVLSAKVSYFHTDIDDLIVSTFNGAAYQNVNISRATIEGFETELRLTPVAWAAFTLAYDHTETRDLSVSPVEPLPRRPENVWKIMAEFHPTPRLGLLLKWSWIDERWDYDFDNAGNPAFTRSFIPAYDVGALDATYAVTPAVQAFARIENIADEQYEPTAGYAASPRAGFIGLRYRR
ncbi:MAG: TonB-dependent receptor plug domain-containing protein [Hyphomonadaceae bacterium]